MKKNKALFLDRDGIINELYFDQEFGIIDAPLNAKQIQIVFGIVDVIKKAQELGYLIIVISNQPQMALKKISKKIFNNIQAEIEKRLNKEGAKIDFYYYCLHHPFAKVTKFRANCQCRKPKAGLLLQASTEHNLDLSASWMLGDGVMDVIAGKEAGCKTILLANLECAENLRILEKQLGNIRPDSIVKKLPSVLDLINH